MASCVYRLTSLHPPPPPPPWVLTSGKYHTTPHHTTNTHTNTHNKLTIFIETPPGPRYFLATLGWIFVSVLCSLRERERREERGEYPALAIESLHYTASLQPSPSSRTLVLVRGPANITNNTILHSTDQPQ